MMLSKKKKNIFNNQVVPDNLFDDGADDTNSIFNIINGEWLENESPSVYKSSLKSAFEFTELFEKYKSLEEKEKQTNANDMFKMAALKNKIQNFKLRKNQEQKVQEKLNYPSESELTLQKITDFFNSSYIRKCKLTSKTLTVESEKEKSWKQISIEPYHF